MYIASTKKRVLAFLLDQFMTYLFYLPLIVKVGLHYLKSNHEIFVPWTWLIAITILHILFQVLCLYVLRGLPAQWLLGLKVESVYHPEMGLSLSQCFIHAIADKLKFLIGNALYFSGFWNRERRHIVNLLAETRVMQKESTQGLLEPRWTIGTLLFVFTVGSTIVENANLLRETKFTISGFTIDIGR